MPPPAGAASPFAALALPLPLALSLALALALLALLASYCCCCQRRRRPTILRHPASLPLASPHPAQAVSLPRIIFVADDDDGSDGSDGRAPGLDQAAISSYPKFPFAASKGGDTACSICLCEYREGEMLRLLPDCRHYFHLICIDVWLRLNASCPVCRTSPLPTPNSTPISTPLSELVPLSQFAADRRRS